ncbi:MAG: hypothetical protein RLZZ535_685 [Cyanobacteriota bacterium]|jgi:hypothetical protein
MHIFQFAPNTLVNGRGQGMKLDTVLVDRY